MPIVHVVFVMKKTPDQNNETEAINVLINRHKQMFGKSSASRENFVANSKNIIFIY